MAVIVLPYRQEVAVLDHLGRQWWCWLEQTEGVSMLLNINVLISRTVVQSSGSILSISVAEPPKWINNVICLSVFTSDVLFYLGCRF